MENGRVLVHCKGGRSRSSAFIAAYLMSSCNMQFDQVWQLILAARPTAELNPGFETQLRSYGLARYDIYTAQQILLRNRVRALKENRMNDNSNTSNIPNGTMTGIPTTNSAQLPSSSSLPNLPRCSAKLLPYSYMKQKMKNIQSASTERWSSSRSNSNIHNSNKDILPNIHTSNLNHISSSSSQMVVESSPSKSPRHGIPRLEININNNSNNSNYQLNSSNNNKKNYNNFVCTNLTKSQITALLKLQIPIPDSSAPEITLTRPTGKSCRVIPLMRGLQRVFCCDWCDAPLFRLSNVIRLDQRAIILLNEVLEVEEKIKQQQQQSNYQYNNNSHMNNFNSQQQRSQSQLPYNQLNSVKFPHLGGETTSNEGGVDNVGYAMTHTHSMESHNINGGSELGNISSLPALNQSLNTGLSLRSERLFTPCNSLADDPTPSPAKFNQHSLAMFRRNLSPRNSGKGGDSFQGVDFSSNTNTASNSARLASPSDSFVGSMLSRSNSSISAIGSGSNHNNTSSRFNTNMHTDSFNENIGSAPPTLSFGTSSKSFGKSNFGGVGGSSYVAPPPSTRAKGAKTFDFGGDSLFPDINPSASQANANQNNKLNTASGANDGFAMPVGRLSLSHRKNSGGDPSLDLRVIDNNNSNSAAIATPSVFMSVYTKDDVHEGESTTGLTSLAASRAASSNLLDQDDNHHPSAQQQSSSLMTHQPSVPLLQPVLQMPVSPRTLMPSNMPHQSRSDKIDGIKSMECDVVAKKNQYALPLYRSVSLTDGEAVQNITAQAVANVSSTASSPRAKSASVPNPFVLADSMAENTENVMKLHNANMAISGGDETGYDSPRIPLNPNRKTSTESSTSRKHSIEKHRIFERLKLLRSGDDNKVRL